MTGHKEGSNAPFFCVEPFLLI